MIYKTAFTLTSAIALISCGPEALEFDPEVQKFGTVPANLTAVYDKDADTVTLSDGTDTVVLSREPAQDVDGFDGFVGGGEIVHASFAMTSSGAGYVAVAVSPTSETFGGVGGVEFGRLTETELPTSGTATFTGRYVGWLTSPEFFAESIISADAALTADFDSSEISGMITNRAVSFFPIPTASDLSLDSTDIVAGSFTGTTSGGVIDDPASSVSAGEYSGMFTGEDGTEIVGGVIVGHAYEGNAFQEIGAFIAEQ